MKWQAVQVTCTGRRDVSLGYTYLGADDNAGPNYTNQPAVNSYYQRKVSILVLDGDEAEFCPDRVDEPPLRRPDG